MTDQAAPTDAPPSGAGLSALTAVGVVLAVALAFTAVVLSSGDDTGTVDAGPVPVSLTEFAIDPATVTVPAGGSLHVQNDGSADHNLAVRDTDLVTADLAGGESAELDVSSLEPGRHELWCDIPGHADSGMTGSLEVVEGAAPAAAAAEGDHSAHSEMDFDAMDAAMEESILAFPAETEGRGNERLEPEVLDDGTKRFELTAEVTPWEVEPGNLVDAWTYNGMVPGPQIHLDIGDRVEIELHNELPMGTDLHVHGINLPFTSDGVAPITQELIQPGESFTYEFTTDEVAVAMYHAHHHAQMTVPNGLLGMLYVGDVPLPRGETVGGQAVPDDVEIAHELPMVLNDTGVIGYSLNGKSFPATEPVVAEQGDWMLVHYANEGAQIHPMHLHQFDQIVVAKDGFPLDQPYVADTVNVAPGERYSVLVELDAPGTWVWHCHILSHAERETGMFGMVTAVVVE